MRQFAEVYPGIALDLVDIDAAVITLANEWYGLGSIPGLSVHVGDGAAFVARAAPASWDAVVVDAYDGTELPPGLCSRTFIRDVRRVLRPGGGLAFNVIGALAGPGGLVLQAIARVVRAELDDVRLLPVLDADEAYSATAQRNVVVLGRC